MIYAFIFLTFWMIVLTFFVVKLTNQMGQLDNKPKGEDDSKIKTPEAALKTKIMEIHEVKQKEENLDELAKKLDKVLADKDRTTLENWINKPDPLEQPVSQSIEPYNDEIKITANDGSIKTLPVLNRDYKQY